MKYIHGMGATQKPRAACYCRISSDPKDKREGVDRQREDTATLCELKGWKIADVYIDNDRSASNGKGRPEWERLLADIKAGKIDAVAAWDQDRVNRMMEDFVHYKKLFVQRGILLATSNNGDIDLSTPSGVLTATIKTAVSEHEVAMMRIRMKRAARQKAEQGIPKWKRAFGYLGDTRQPDPATAPLVKEAYAAVLAGGSITDVARAWNAAGAYGLTGKPWSASTVSLFLRAPRNCGLRSHNNEIVGRGTWPPLVDESTWRAAQSVLNAPGRAPGRKTVRRHLLTGVLQCGKTGCGGYLSGQWTTQKTITYACKRCRGVSIRAEHVEPLVYGVIAGRLAKPDAVDLLKAEIHDAAEAEALRVERLALLGRLDEIADERADGLLTGQQAQRATARITDKLDAIERRQQDQERLQVFDGLPLGKPEVADAIKELSPDRLRAVIDVLVEFVVAPVGKGGHVFHPDRVAVNWR
jgi:DNA invertase Pin-like site-specific DNA recombinase